MIKFSVLVIVMMVSLASQAEPIGEIRFTAKILSSDGKLVDVEASGRKYRVPKEACTGDVVIGRSQEIALTPEQYYEMKNLVKHQAKN